MRTAERPVRGAAGSLKPDVYFEFAERKIAVEVQHSYQSLSEYHQRQRKYHACGIDGDWLLYRRRFLTMVKSIAQYRIRNEFGGKFPQDREYRVPIGSAALLFEPEAGGGSVCGPDLDAPVATRLHAIAMGQLRFVNDSWRIV